MVVSNGTLNQSISLGKPTNIAKCDEIVDKVHIMV